MSEDIFKKLPRIDVDIPMPKTTPPRDSSLPAWESVKECPKCGTTRITKETRDWTTNPQQFKYKIMAPMDGLVGIDFPERIQVTCPRCGHEWGEQTKDAANE